MPDLQSTTNPRDNQESSVLFNLRDLMRLEAERVAAEEAAARAAAGRAEQARAERERAAREAAQRAAHEAHARELEARATEDARALQREAALLRIRSEVAARERAESQRLELEHEHALQMLQRDARRSRLTQSLWALIVAIAVGGAAGYTFIVQPSLRAARDAAAAQAQKVQTLQLALSELGSARAIPPAIEVAASPVPEPAAASAAQAGPTRAKKAPKLARKPKPDATADDDLILGDGNDPLDGLPDVDEPARRSR